VRDRLLDIIQKHWGYSSLRPLQQEAMLAALSGRDSLVVMPTGGGKSLCYQAPALLSDSVTVIVSPLISLMKDQVDRAGALRQTAEVAVRVAGAAGYAGLSRHAPPREREDVRHRRGPLHQPLGT
jgi:superfamily II DNA helicase RecQ